MQDTELFLSLAEIAGVFVGFAALISVRSGGAREAHEVVFIRWVVTLGVWAVGLVLSLGAFTLLLLVVSQRRLAAASGPAALPATGGSSA